MARPRSDTAHQAALDATVATLLDSGVDGVTLEEVAKRSGVARSTLYRHFKSKEELVAKAARMCVVEHPTPDTGSLEGDLRFLFERYRETEEARQVPSLLPMLVDAAARDPLLRASLDDFLAERRRPMLTILQLAQLRGEIGRDVDIDAALSLIFGPFTHRRMLEQREVTPEFIDMVLNATVAALRATADTPTPATP